MKITHPQAMCCFSNKYYHKQQSAVKKRTESNSIPGIVYSICEEQGSTARAMMTYMMSGDGNMENISISGLFLQCKW